MNCFCYDTPVGSISIEDDGNFVTSVSFEKKKSSDKESELAKNTYFQLLEYFQKKRKRFDVPVNPEGTEFQKSVWKALCEIPYGSVCTYKDIAEKINNPKAFRAVGAANNKNPLLIIIPCHRVVSADGSLAGYSGGLAAKRFLLDLEKG